MNFFPGYKLVKIGMSTKKQKADQLLETGALKQLRKELGWKLKYEE